MPGEVKLELSYLLDLIRTERVIDKKNRLEFWTRLFMFLDDLDCCLTATIMAVLQAVTLLFVDAPVTCFLAIDSRVVVSSINKHYGDEFEKEGLLDGYKFLDKIVQLPFCVPDFAHNSKSAFFQKILMKCELDPTRIYERLKVLNEIKWMPFQ